MKKLFKRVTEENETLEMFCGCGLYCMNTCKDSDYLMISEYQSLLNFLKF